MLVTCEVFGFVASDLTGSRIALGKPSPHRIPADVLGQEAVSDQSSGITAIPVLVELLAAPPCWRQPRA